MNRKSRKSRRGVALVETALSLSLFTAILFSLTDAGWVMFLHQTLASRAEAAARYGALYPTDTTGMQNIVLYGSSTAGSSALFGLTTSNVRTSRSGLGSTADRIIISVTGVHYTMIMPGLSGIAQDIVVSVPVEAN